MRESAAFALVLALSPLVFVTLPFMALVNLWRCRSFRVASAGSVGGTVAVLGDAVVAAGEHITYERIRNLEHWVEHYDNGGFASGDDARHVLVLRLTDGTRRAVSRGWGELGFEDMFLDKRLPSRRRNGGCLNTSLARDLVSWAFFAFPSAVGWGVLFVLVWRSLRR